MIPGKKASKSSERQTPLWLETLKVAPQVIWVLVGAWLLFLFAGPLLRTLEQGSITKLGIGVLQIEVAQKQIQQAATAHKQEKIPAGLKARIERAPRVLFDAAILWLDDNPARNVVERRALASLGLTVDTARTTAEALAMLAGGRYHVVISDFSREEAKTPCPKPENREDPGGCDLISQLNRSFEKDNRGRTTERAQPPVIFFGSFFRPDDGAPAYSFGATSRVDELFHLVLDALERRSIQP